MSVSILDWNLIAENALLSLFEIYLLGLAELEFVKHGVCRHTIVRHCTTRIV